MAGLFTLLARAFGLEPTPPKPQALVARPRRNQERYTQFGEVSMLPRKHEYESDRRKSHLPEKASPPFLQTLTVWDIASALSALREHEMGNMNRSGLLWRYMINRDDRLRTVMNVRCGAIAALPFAVLPATEGKLIPAELEAAAELKAGWDASFPEDTLRATLRVAVGMGVVVARISWHPGKFDYWWPKLTVWPEEAVRYDDAEKCWWALSREGGEVKVTPGDGTWFLWEPDGARGWQLGAVMALALPVLITAYNWQDWMNFNDAHGRPIRKIRVPRGATPNEVATFLANVKALGRYTSSIILRRQLQPNDDFDFEFVTPAGQAAIVDTFLKSIDACNNAKATLILGQTLTTDAANGGNRALGEIHNQIKNQILKADADGLATALRSQVIRWWAIYNLGSASLAPRVKWQTGLPADIAAEATTQKAIGDALTAIINALKGTGKRLKIAKWVEKFDLPVEDEPIVEAAPNPPTPITPQLAPKEKEGPALPEKIAA